MPFTNKTAIVTGAAQGIGKEICRQLAAQGANVLLNDIDVALSETTAEVINQDVPGQCVAVPGDAGDIDFIRSMVEKAKQQTGKLDIAIANAGITLFGDFLTYPEDSFDRVLALNLKGSFYLAQAAVNVMKSQPQGGSLLFMSSVTGHQAHEQLAAYGMTKAALELLARNLVIEVSKFKINVNTIAPGATLTERTQDDPEYAKIWAEITPLGSAATVLDIANAALFLVSDEARHITGQNLVVDGGWTSVSPPPRE